jgi:uncharacterized protein DUF6457
MKMKFAIPPG